MNQDVTFDEGSHINSIIKFVVPDLSFHLSPIDNDSSKFICSKEKVVQDDTSENDIDLSMKATKDGSPYKMRSSVDVYARHKMVNAKPLTCEEAYKSSN